MREILCRGKCMETGEWFHGYLLRNDKETFIVAEFETSNDYGDGLDLYATYFKKVESETVGQYTGLVDKNGTEIHEGDVVKVIHEDGCETIGQVEWGLSSKWFSTYPAFAIRELESEMNSFAEVFDTGQYTIEIIGNIYENPELLEVSV